MAIINVSDFEEEAREFLRQTRHSERNLNRVADAIATFSEKFDAWQNLRGWAYDVNIIHRRRTTRNSAVIDKFIRLLDSNLQALMKSQSKVQNLPFGRNIWDVIAKEIEKARKMERNLKIFMNSQAFADVQKKCRCILKLDHCQLEVDSD